MYIDNNALNKCIYFTGLHKRLHYETMDAFLAENHGHKYNPSEESVRHIKV